MKTQPIGYTNQDFVFNANIRVEAPHSGFLLQIGRNEEQFEPIVSFSGYNGYIFDQSGHFVGGYRKFQPIALSGNYFAEEQRLSYFINDTLISNSIECPSGFFDSIRFDDQNEQNTLSFEYLTKGSPTILADSEGVYLLSSEGFYLGAS